MLTTSIYEFRKNLASYLDEVEGENTKVVIKRFGKPVAVVVAYEQSDEIDTKRYFGFMGKGEDGEKFLARVRRNARELERTKRLRKGYA
jgi:prevent-host-death family protein